jgi:hypothetical protein
MERGSIARDYRSLMTVPIKKIDKVIGIFTFILLKKLLIMKKLLLVESY